MQKKKKQQQQCFIASHCCKVIALPIINTRMEIQINENLHY